MSDLRLRARFAYRGLRARLRDQRTEIRALAGSLAPGDVAVDVGANKGAYLPSLARAVPDGRVVAFEPQPALAAYLARACAAAGLENVVVEAVGVSDRDGSLPLAVPGRGASSQDASFEPGVRARAGEGRILEVPVRTLDGYFADEPGRIGALKIDVEGHELSVLRGAAGLLAEHGPLLVCEIEARHLPDRDVHRVLDWLRSAGYGGHFVRRGRLVPLGEFDPERHQSTSGARYWDRPDYCNNFILTRTRG